LIKQQALGRYQKIQNKTRII